MDYKIVCAHGHYEVYDNKGNFICSGDTENEAESEAEKYLTEREMTYAS